MNSKHAWQLDRELRLSALPLDRRTHQSNWYTSETAFPAGDDLIALFWFSSVPGSGAPEIPYLEMVQAMGNKGYDVRRAEQILYEGMGEARKCGILDRACFGETDGGVARLFGTPESGDVRATPEQPAHPGLRENDVPRAPKPAVSPELRALTAELLHEIHRAPRDPSHPYWNYTHPAGWEAVRAEMPAAEPSAVQEGAARTSTSGTDSAPAHSPDNLEARIHAGWLGQLAGGAFGTAIEGYHTAQLQKVYGRVDAYITEPETVNDDVVYELAFLDAFEHRGRDITSRDIGREWVKQIPFGWSAEWIALHNMTDGFLPPESGSRRNPYSNWIGAQMRGMVCGLVAPARPMEAARLAHIDGVVSHAENGVYGEMYAAVLTARAFTVGEPRALLREAARFIPKRSEYAAVLSKCFDTVEHSESAEAAWEILDQYFERYNWIHAYPNIAAVITALWFGNGDMTESFRILAHAGLDVDCNAGLAGTALGIMGGVPEKWARPLHDTLETYLAGKERLGIRELAARTARLAER
jgi:ADP-ribosylglycohydrolase